MSRPPASMRSALIGANQAGASIWASGGTSSAAIRFIAAARLTRPYPKCGSQPVSALSGRPVIPVLTGLHVLGGHRQELADLVAGQRVVRRRTRRGRTRRSARRRPRPGRCPRSPSPPSSRCRPCRRTASGSSCGRSSSSAAGPRARSRAGWLPSSPNSWLHPAVKSAGGDGDRQDVDAGQAARPGAGVVRRRVGKGTRDVDRLVVVRRVVVVRAVDVRGDHRQRHALLVGELEDVAREAGVAEAADRALDHRRAVARRVEGRRARSSRSARRRCPRPAAA